MENSILGLPSYYHHYLYSYELRRIQVTYLWLLMGVIPCLVFLQTSEAMLSYSFGQLLYEMIMCRPLSAGMMETTPPDMAAVVSKYIPQSLVHMAILYLKPVGPVVESLLTKEAIKKPLPTINDLIDTE